MTEPILQITREDGWAWMTLNRPRVLNALSSELMFAISDEMASLQADPTVVGLVITGAGRAFSAGLDLEEVAGLKGYFPEAELGRATYACFDALERFDRPMIAAINGPAITGGFEIALTCDILVASTAARFADTHVRVGILPGAGLSQKLSRVIGTYRARELSLTGRMIEAEMAERWGLINRRVAPEQLYDTCRGIAAEIGAHRPAIVQAYRRLIHDGFRTTLGEGMKLEMQTHLDFARQPQAVS
jgi:enoyl-CoA hydratase